MLNQSRYDNFHVLPLYDLMAIKHTITYITVF